MPSPAGLGLQDHVCWTYDDDAERVAASIRFLADGMNLGQRLMYVRDATVDEMGAELEGLGDVTEMVAAGGLQIVPLGSIYPIGERTDADVMLAIYIAATDQALADGYTGLRVVADATPLVADPANWGAHTHWETVAERHMVERPVAAMCCYDRRVLGEQVVRDLACVHPLAHGPSELCSFQLFAREGALSLEGEVDYFSTDSLRRALDVATPADGQLVLDLTGLRFIDHTGVLALADHSRRLAADGRWPVYLAPDSVHRTCELLGVTL